MLEDNQQTQTHAEPQPEQAAQPKQSEDQQQTDQQQPRQKPEKPEEKPIKTTQDEKMWSAIGYIAFLGVVTLAMKPKSQFCRHHASQGLVFFVLWFIGLILLAIGSFFSVIGGLLMLGITVLAVMGIIKAISSYEFKLPVLTDIAKNVPVDAIIGSMTGKKAVDQPKQPQQPQPEQQESQQPEQTEPEVQNPTQAPQPEQPQTQEPQQPEKAEPEVQKPTQAPQPEQPQTQEPQQPEKAEPEVQKPPQQ